MTSTVPIDRAWARRIRSVLFDFDGPVCRLFDGHDTSLIAHGLRDVLRRHGVDVTDWEAETNAHLLLRQAAERSFAIPAEAREWLTVCERDAAATAKLTPGLRELLQDLSLPLAVASNNALEAIKDCLGREGLLERFTGGIHGRDPLDPGKMKPDPDCVERALAGLGVSDPVEAVLIGDTEADAEAAKSAGVAFIGYVPDGRANGERLLELGARGIVSDISQLIGTFRSLG